MEREFKPISSNLTIVEALDNGFIVPVTLNVENYKTVVVKDCNNNVISSDSDELLVEEVLKNGGKLDGSINGYLKYGTGIKCFYISF